MATLTNEEKLAKYDAMMKTAEKARVRRSARITLTLAKAKEKGIAVSEKEIDEYLKSTKTSTKTSK